MFFKGFAISFHRVRIMLGILLSLAEDAAMNESESNVQRKGAVML